MQTITPPCRGTAAASARDPRWEALNAVRDARAALGLRDRTIAVLRGLLTLVPAAAWDDRPVVHAANATLQERCDGMDERTLRRHLAILVAAGLIRRQQSPNRKRYVVRDDRGAVLLAYGFDLSPLRAAVAGLHDLAAAEQATAARARALRAVLRDHLFHLGEAEGLEDYRRLLRRKVGTDVLEAAIATLAARRGAEPPCPVLPDTPILTGSDGQDDRHIQSSKQDSCESEAAPASSTLPSVDQCRERASTAVAFAPTEPRTWGDLVALADRLGPGLGINGQVLGEAEIQLGRRGRALAILGLTQAYPQIKRPDSYLRALLRKAKTGALNLQRMFDSLTSGRRHGRFPAGNPA